MRPYCKVVRGLTTPRIAADRPSNPSAWRTGEPENRRAEATAGPGVSRNTRVVASTSNPASSATCRKPQAAAVEHEPLEVAAACVEAGER